uniref:Uncharacterized protein n=1 Tax=Acinetobacter nosocomialis TaxID=106654 RepID=A0A7S9DQE9_ACINO|nr:hypothetical protein WM98B_00139 [Acinetobacter nosocomialis]
MRDSRLRLHAGLQDRPLEAERVFQQPPVVAPELALVRSEHLAAGGDRPIPPGVAVGDHELQVAELAALRRRVATVGASGVIGHHQRAAIDLDLGVDQSRCAVGEGHAAQLLRAEGAGVEVAGFGGTASHGHVGNHAVHHGGVGGVGCVAHGSTPSGG